MNLNTTADYIHYHASSDGIKAGKNREKLEAIDLKSNDAYLSKHNSGSNTSYAKRHS